MDITKALLLLSQLKTIDAEVFDGKISELVKEIKKDISYTGSSVYNEEVSSDKLIDIFLVEAAEINKDMIKESGIQLVEYYDKVTDTFKHIALERQWKLFKIGASKRR